MFPLPFQPSRIGLYALAGILGVLLVIAGWLAFDTSGKLKAATRRVATVTQERDRAREQLGEWRAVVAQWEAINETWKVAVADMREAKQQADQEIADEQGRTRKLRQDLKAASAELKRRKPVGATDVERLVDADRNYQQQLRGLQ